MAGNRNKPRIEKIRLRNNGQFVDFDDTIRFLGTYLMREELEFFHELALQTAAKGFSTEVLRDNQEIFVNKLQGLRWVNGYNDCSDSDFYKITDDWHQAVLDLVDDFREDNIYDYDEETEVLEINIASFSKSFIDIERIIYRKASAYD